MLCFGICEYGHSSRITMWKEIYSSDYALNVLKTQCTHASGIIKAEGPPQFFTRCTSSQAGEYFDELVKCHVWFTISASTKNETRIFSGICMREKCRVNGLECFFTSISWWAFLFEQEKKKKSNQMNKVNKNEQSDMKTVWLMILINHIRYKWWVTCLNPR